MAYAENRGSRGLQDYVSNNQQKLPQLLKEAKEWAGAAETASLEKETEWELIERLAATGECMPVSPRDCSRGPHEIPLSETCGSRGGPRGPVRCQETFTGPSHEYVLSHVLKWAAAQGWVLIERTGGFLFSAPGGASGAPGEAPGSR